MSNSILRRNFVLGAAMFAGTAQAFAAQEKTYPWLTGINKTVGMFEHDFQGGYIAASAVLLDRQGTVVLTAHQVRDTQDTTSRGSPKLSFYLKSGVVVSTPLANIVYDASQDIAFATIDSAFVAKNGLVPAELGKTGILEPYTDIVAVGFNAGDRRLTTAYGQAAQFDPSVEANGRGAWLCKEAMYGTIEKSMSGGAAFSQGKLVGIFNGTGKTSSIFTPIEAVKAAWIKLYPEKVGLKTGPALPEACKVSRRDFVSLFTPKS